MLKITAVVPMQGVNEALFVPSGWHHSVENVEDTLSINHNWLNGFNIHWSWDLLQQEHAAATAAIEECRCRQLSHRTSISLGGTSFTISSSCLKKDNYLCLHASVLNVLMSSIPLAYKFLQATL